LVFNFFLDKFLKNIYILPKPFSISTVRASECWRNCQKIFWDHSWSSRGWEAYGSDFDSSSSDYPL